MKVSAHALVKRDGSLVQFVSCLDRAWHAGRSSFEGEEECNDFSVGIELEGADDIPYTADQYLALPVIVILLPGGRQILALLLTGLVFSVICLP